MLSQMYFHLASSPPAENIPSFCKREITAARSLSDKNFAVSGKSWTTKKEIAPITTDRRPSRIKIHALVIHLVSGRKVQNHDSPLPSRLPSNTTHVRNSSLEKVSGHGQHWNELGILTARRPPNAPDTVAAEKKSAARSPNSERLYQLRGNDESKCSFSGVGTNSCA